MLKNSFFILTLSLLFVMYSCSKGPKNKIKITDTTQVKFDTYVYNFDTINQGDKIVYIFTFTNIGKAPYIVKNTGTSCGCTVAYAPKKPIKPGEKSYIKVEFNSTGKIGEQYKTIFIEGNSKPSRIELVLKGFVRPPKIENTNTK